ncbi:MAG TPA: hypothetical protein VFY05_01425 [Candidatus Angelobacter sp.]|nr:hypothetical protein [Candidatus Angelobacter sp.]
MKYLNPGPMFFGPAIKRRPLKTIVVRGGPAAEIPKRDRCASGRHNKRLTDCYCASIPSGK